MTLPILANIKKKEYFDIYIGRRNDHLNLEHSKFANPFVMKTESERNEVVQKFEIYARNNPDIMDSLDELDGKVLGCYCYSHSTNTGKKCHGYILIKLFEEKFKVFL